MEVKCPICKSRTDAVRSPSAKGTMVDYICRNCNIAWYIDENNKYRIRLSTTHALASKLSDEEFNKLIELIKKHSVG
ncbi:MAG: hypothetical protein ACE5PM_06400 [Candidatus Hydrothermarchaeales archaeon]